MIIGRAHPQDCPEFDYEHHPDHETVLPGICHDVTIEIRRGVLDIRDYGQDTRPVHQRLFLSLTPPSYQYFAGNYRGAPFRCLEHYSVGVDGDPRVGSPPRDVDRQMRELSAIVSDGIGVLDNAMQQPTAQISMAERLTYVTAFACSVFETFLRIHPFANGNGHIARFILLAILGRYEFWLQRWEINERPPDPPYSVLISRYRDGHLHELEQFVIECLNP